MTTHAAAPPRTTLRALLDGLAAAPIERDAPVTGLADDARLVAPGDLFVARLGPRADGRAHIAAAVERGAAAIACQSPATPDHRAAAGGLPMVEIDRLGERLWEIAERFYGNPARGLPVLGVTGTNGKTTVVRLAAGLLEAAGLPAATIGTLGARVGGEPVRTTLTTPGAIELSALFARAASAGDRTAVMELSSHALAQHRTDALGFSAAVFTNLSRDHLDDHGDMDRYAAAKARLFERLEPDALAVVNADDPATERMLRDCRAPVLRCSFTAGDASVTVERESLDGLDLTLRGPWGEARATTPLLGRFNAMNALQAFAAAHALLRDIGHAASAESLASALAGIPAPPGRFERVPTERTHVFVDFAHTPAALETALTGLRALMPHGTRLICVFGCGGDRDRGKRPEMGAVAARLADLPVVTSDNPRTEDPGAIIAEVRAGMSAAAETLAEPDRARAIRLAVERARPGDVVLIAGKGHERDQILPDGNGGTYRIEFDDRAVAAEALAEARAEVRP